MSFSFSVVTPSYNQLDWLKLCAASISDQERVKVEHIVQDAGTGAELEAWATRQPLVKLFVEKDQGMYDAINRGLRRATGDICSYLNCDEQYLPGTLALVDDFFASHPDAEVVFGDGILVDKSGKPLSYRRVVKPYQWHTRLSHLGVMSCSTFFRRSIVERGLIFDPSWRIIGDAIWVNSLLDANVKIEVLPKPLAVYTFTNENLSDDPRAKAESARWRQMPGAPPHWLRPMAIASHRFRKLLAGAYSPHRGNIEVYTMQSPDRRVSFSGDSLGYDWPRDPAVVAGGK